MGAGQSNPHEAAENKRISEQQRKDAQQFKQKIKLLLLGAGESGKSALFKQVRALYGTPLSSAELQNFRKIVHNNLYEFMSTLCEGVVSHQIESLIENQEVHKAMLSLKYEAISQPLTPHVSVGAGIKMLWEDPGIQAMWSKRSDLQVLESHSAFLDDIDRIISADYEPTVADTVLARVRSTGVVTSEFQIDGSTLMMVDVGGQRSERRKWIHVFDSVDAIVYVVALSEYDLTCFEDETTNRMREALTLFSWLLAHESFSQVDMILFLNKSDLFTAKLPHVPISSVSEWSDYSGDGSFDSGVAYFRQKFADLVTGRRELYLHVTCATNPDNVQRVFHDCQDVVTRKTMDDSGFV
eukprot:c25282_g1_i1.p1 GENE.c25282_g1_i1~~c25282_g1_i1.p1  ORF type:complete len:354 (-),score=67.39 c25282_g1_i1:108-1169(-)